jgi:hypothetical protein
MQRAPGQHELGQGAAQKLKGQVALVGAARLQLELTDHHEALKAAKE